MLEQVARHRNPRLLAQAALLVRGSHEAEDLVQDALVSTFASRARFDSIGEAEQYVRRAVVSRFLDGTRRGSRERAGVARIAAAPGAGVHHDVVPGLPPELAEALMRLAPRVRACVVLRHVEDLSVRETAQLLRISEGTVKRYVSDGVAALNAALGTTETTADAVAVQTTGGAR
jgi:RNA polymerase sigma factor (sigma-70 family)